MDSKRKLALAALTYLLARAIAPKSVLKPLTVIAGIVFGVTAACSAIAYVFPETAEDSDEIAEAKLWASLEAR